MEVITPPITRPDMPDFPCLMKMPYDANGVHLVSKTLAYVKDEAPKASNLTVAAFYQVYRQVCTCGKPDCDHIIRVNRSLRGEFVP
jgi:hypothetical protein